MITRLAGMVLAVAVLAAAGWFLVAAAADANRPPPLASAISAPALARTPSAVVLGNPQGDVTLVEYFDYQCPACRRVHSALTELAAEDRKLRVVHKHWPVFGGASVYAAKIALASRWQGRYAAVHDALMAIDGRIDENRIRTAAAGVGLDVARAERDLNERAADLDAMLAEVAAEAELLQLRGTPRFVVGGYLTQGSLDLRAMRTMVDKARAEAKRG